LAFLGLGLDLPHGTIGIALEDDRAAGLILLARGTRLRRPQGCSKAEDALPDNDQSCTRIGSSAKVGFVPMTDTDLAMASSGLT
jgi:hypothetical protein